jgi:hypothetical protein
MGAPRKNYDGAVALYNAGLSVGDVALAYGVTRQAMWDILKRRGVKFRPHLRYGEDNHFFRDGIPFDARVHAITTAAIMCGRLIPAPCETCGATGAHSDGRNIVEAHHDDYNKPLVVRWLCKTCHFRWHEDNSPVRRTIDLPPMPRKAIGRLGGLAAQRKKRA